MQIPGCKGAADQRPVRVHITTVGLIGYGLRLFIHPIVACLERRILVVLIIIVHRPGVSFTTLIWRTDLAFQCCVALTDKIIVSLIDRIGLCAEFGRRGAAGLKQGNREDRKNAPAREIRQNIHEYTLPLLLHPGKVRTK